MKLTDEEKTLIWTAYADNEFKLNEDEIYNKLSEDLKQKINKEQLKTTIQNFEYELYILDEQLKYQLIFGEYY